MKPGDLLLGVLDFFAVLLPGSLATWLVAQYFPPGALRRALSFGLDDGASRPDSFVLGAALLVSSYTLGHFVFMGGAQLDSVYDRWRKAAKPTSRDVTFRAARDLQKKLTSEIADGEFSTLKWAKTYVQIKAPGARAEIDRLEADSKFFRSLVIVLIAFTAHFLLREHAPVAGIVTLAMAVLSYQRFRQQRWKMTELSYGSAVIAHALENAASSAKTIAAEAGATG